ncbi:transcription factor HES-1-A-like [Penaeus indicus]|uniref:transcription factor HES-1-A-like n=1 Tax=Penaeus indicus TaxID=29960 RepID=UPI00300D9094
MGVQQQQQVVNKARAPKPVSEARKIRKPLMEKKRRERINTSLNDLARLLTDAKMVKSDGGKANKLEKADILELTVKHLKALKTEGGDVRAENSSTEEPASASYKEGFTKCMGVVDQTLSKAGKDALRERLLTHLQSCLKTLQPVASPTDARDAHTPQPSEDTPSRLAAPDAPVTPATSEGPQEPSTVQQEGAKDDSASKDSANPESAAKEAPRFTLVPTRLPTGAVAFLIQGGLDPRLLLPQDLTVISSSAASVPAPTPVAPHTPAAPPATSTVQCPPTPPPSSTPCAPAPSPSASPSATPIPSPAPLPVPYQCSSPDPVQFPTHPHAHSPPTPPPSVSPQSFPREFSHFQPSASSEEEEEEMDTDEALSEEEEDEEDVEIDVEVEDDGPYDLSMRRMWRPW